VCYERLGWYTQVEAGECVMKGLAGIRRLKRAGSKPAPTRAWDVI
jgi:hypothetical protein